MGSFNFKLVDNLEKLITNIYPKHPWIKSSMMTAYFVSKECKKVAVEFAKYREKNYQDFENHNGECWMREGEWKTEYTSEEIFDNFINEEYGNT